MRRISQPELKLALSYDTETGHLSWNDDRGNHARRGMVAGRINPDRGYRYIGIGRRLYLAHRLAWLYMTGDWPSLDIDHIDRNRDNNRWANLRLVTRSENLRNSGAHRDNPSGIKGVTWEPGCRKWSARIYDGKKTIHLGRFVSKEMAATAYSKGEQEISGAAR